MNHRNSFISYNDIMICPLFLKTTTACTANNFCRHTQNQSFVFINQFSDQLLLYLYGNLNWLFVSVWKSKLKDWSQHRHIQWWTVGKTRPFCLHIQRKILPCWSPIARDAMTNFKQSRRQQRTTANWNSSNSDQRHFRKRADVGFSNLCIFQPLDSPLPW